MTSYPCNKYEQITPSYLLSVKEITLSYLPIIKLIGDQNNSDLENHSLEARTENFSSRCTPLAEKIWLFFLTSIIPGTILDRVSPPEVVASYPGGNVISLA